jgi:hypothetical protein
LRTIASPLRPATLFQAVVALNKRNLKSAPIAALDISANHFRVIVEYLFKVVFVKDYQQRLRQYECTYGSAPAEDALRTYLKGVPTHTIERALRDGYDPYDFEISNFEYIVKRQIKPAAQLGPDYMVSYPAPQTIMFNKKNVNVFYGALFKEMIERFKSLLKPSVLVNTRKNLDEIEEHMKANLSLTSDLVTIQNDFSKYDKSQGFIVQLIEQEVFKKMGLFNQAMSDWFSGHTVTRNVGYAVGVVVWLMYQRKSGDASTSPGNTIVGLVVVVYAYGITTFVYVMVLGDDSCFFLRRSDFDLDRVRLGPGILGQTFNFEAKIDVYDFGYFCGFFVLPDHAGTPRMVRDPLRVMLKLGRWDVVDQSLLEETYVSFRDSVRGYDDEGVLRVLTVAACQMYKLQDCGAMSVLLASIVTLLRDKSEFFGLWEDNVSETFF